MTQPFISPFMQVEKDWIDYNGHLNMAFYSVLFDRGVDALWDQLGFGEAYLAETGHTTYAGEYRVRYLRELHEGDRVRVSCQFLDHTDKSWHLYQELIHEDGWVSACSEVVGLHIDTSGPRVAPLPEHIHAKFAAFLAEHSRLPRPEWVDQPMGIRRKG